MGREKNWMWTVFKSKPSNARDERKAKMNGEEVRRQSFLDQSSVMEKPFSPISTNKMDLVVRPWVRPVNSVDDPRE